jgi:hypothetical protein
MKRIGRMRLMGLMTSKRSATMNWYWIWLLFKLDEWTCRRLRAAYVREKLRWFKRELERQHARRN